MTSELPVTQADGEMAASIRAALIKACPNMPVYPVGTITPLLAAHRIAALQQSRSAVDVMADCINTADSIIAEHCGIKDTPKEWLAALRKVTEARAVLSQESAVAT